MGEPINNRGRVLLTRSLARCRLAALSKSQTRPSESTVVRSSDQPEPKPSASAYGPSRGGEYTSHTAPCPRTRASPEEINIRSTVPSFNCSAVTSAGRLTERRSSGGVPVVVAVVPDPIVDRVRQ